MKKTYLVTLTQTFEIEAENIEELSENVNKETQRLLDDDHGLDYEWHDATDE